MSGYGLIASVMTASVSIGLNTGCALYHAIAKCGFSGDPGDAKVSSDVRIELDRYPTLQPPNLIDVQTCDHVVYLSGQVSTELMRDLAQAAAAHGAGGRRVLNTISVSDGGG